MRNNIEVSSGLLLVPCPLLASDYSALLHVMCLCRKTMEVADFEDDEDDEAFGDELTRQETIKESYNKLEELFGRNDAQEPVPQVPKAAEPFLEIDGPEVEVHCGGNGCGQKPDPRVP